MSKFGLIGFPLAHSFSSAYFKNKFTQEGIQNCSYESYPIDSIDKLTDLLTIHQELEGLNVTIPYKKAVIPFLHSSTEAVKKMAACNCIKIKNGFLQGHNTDVVGFEKSLSPLLTKKHNRALILGTGGSAAAVEFVLNKLKIDFLFVSRAKSATKKTLTYNDLTEEIITENTLIVNTTPLGMFPNLDSCPDIPYQFLSSNHYLFDLVYNPAETLFLKKGTKMGAVTKNGADMLMIQAEESWKIWSSQAD